MSVRETYFEANLLPASYFRVHGKLTLLEQDEEFTQLGEAYLIDYGPHRFLK
jgi:hypothetical protein